MRCSLARTRATECRKRCSERGMIVHRVCPAFALVAKVSRRRPVQTSPAGCGWWGPRGPSSRQRAGGHGQRPRHERTGVESDRRTAEPSARTKGPRRAACWRQAFGAITSRRSSRSKGGGGTSQLADLAPCQGCQVVKRTSEVGHDGRFRCQQHRLRPTRVGQSEAIAVKRDPRQRALEQAVCRTKPGCSSLKTWKARVGWKHLWSGVTRCRQVPIDC